MVVCLAISLTCSPHPPPPAGVVRLLEVLHDVVSWSPDERAQVSTSGSLSHLILSQFLRANDVVPAALRLLTPSYLAALLQWSATPLPLVTLGTSVGLTVLGCRPEVAGGGSVTVNGIVSLVCRVMFLPFQSSTADPEVSHIPHPRPPFSFRVFYSSVQEGGGGGGGGAAEEDGARAEIIEVSTPATI